MVSSCFISCVATPHFEQVVCNTNNTGEATERLVELSLEISLLAFSPKGSLVQQYWPKWVIMVVRSLD